MIEYPAFLAGFGVAADRAATLRFRNEGLVFGGDAVLADLGHAAVAALAFAASRPALSGWAELVTRLIGLTPVTSHGGHLSWPSGPERPSVPSRGASWRRPATAGTQPTR